jgi:hypothetical protein
MTQPFGDTETVGTGLAGIDAITWTQDTVQELVDYIYANYPGSRVSLLIVTSL